MKKFFFSNGLKCFRINMEVLQKSFQKIVILVVKQKRIRQEEFIYESVCRKSYR